MDASIPGIPKKNTLEGGLLLVKYEDEGREVCYW